VHKSTILVYIIAEMQLDSLKSLKNSYVVVRTQKTVLCIPSIDELIVVLLTSYLVAAATLQCLWSLTIASVEIYALLVKRSFRNLEAACLFSIGDGVSHIFSGS
jgi:hypothetical protein